MKFAISLIVLIGFVGLVVEAGHFFENPYTKDLTAEEAVGVIAEGGPKSVFSTLARTHNPSEIKVGDANGTAFLNLNSVRLYYCNRDHLNYRISLCDEAKKHPNERVANNLNYYCRVLFERVVMHCIENTLEIKKREDKAGRAWMDSLNKIWGKYDDDYEIPRDALEFKTIYPAYQSQEPTYLEKAIKDGDECGCIGGNCF